MLIDRLLGDQNTPPIIITVRKLSNDDVKRNLEKYCISNAGSMTDLRRRLIDTLNEMDDNEDWSKEQKVPARTWTYQSLIKLTRPELVDIFQSRHKTPAVRHNSKASICNVYLLILCFFLRLAQIQRAEYAL